MNAHQSTLRIARAARRPPIASATKTPLTLRYFHLSKSQNATPSLHPELTSPQSRPGSVQQGSNDTRLNLISRTDQLKMTPAQRAAAAARKARENLKKQEEKVESNQKRGSLAENSLFADEFSTALSGEDPSGKRVSDDFSERDPANMARALNPRPSARARWHRTMVIRHIRRGGRLSKKVIIARTERSHLSRSHFFKTSMKKLAPLARQIAGKPIEEAILQMRFSNKKAAISVHEHLVQARNEAIVIKGMGLRPDVEADAEITTIDQDPSATPPKAHQNPTKSNKKGYIPHETDMYVAEAWTNRGPYGKEPDYRARGQMNILRPPHTGISVLLKEEKTKTRIKAEKEAKSLRKRMGKNMWTQLPDRKITDQRQYLLW